MTGERSEPMWSSAERAKKALARGRLVGTGKLIEIAWRQFLEDWVPRLERAELRVGLNWTGPDVTGVGWSVHDVIAAIDSGEFREADARRRSR